MPRSVLTARTAARPRGNQFLSENA
jgi:hypothetical protein